MKSKISWKFLGCFLVGLVVVSGCATSESVLKVTEKEIENKEETEDIEETDKREEQEKKSQEDREAVFVEVSGAVLNPGVYELPQESRVFQAIALAGGLKEDAVTEQINQAEKINDGQKIYVYTKEEIQQKKEEKPIQEQRALEDGKIDLNHADKDMLMTLQGIGAARADAILSYREKRGGFSGIEELMQVEGIKKKTYEKLKDQIVVN